MEKYAHNGDGGYNMVMPRPPDYDWRTDPNYPDAEALRDVDESLIECNLQMTVEERMRMHQQFLVLVDALRQAGQEFYGFDPRAVIEAAQLPG